MVQEQENLIKDFILLMGNLKNALKGQRIWLARTIIDLAIKQLVTLKKELEDDNKLS